MTIIKITKSEHLKYERENCRSLKSIALSLEIIAGAQLRAHLTGLKGKLLKEVIDQMIVITNLNNAEGIEGKEKEWPQMS